MSQNCRSRIIQNCVTMLQSFDGFYGVVVGASVESSYKRRTTASEGDDPIGRFS